MILNIFLNGIHIKVPLFEISKVTVQSVDFMFLVTLALTFDISRYHRYFSRNQIKHPGISI